MVRKQMNISKPLKMHYTLRNSIKQGGIDMVVSVGHFIFYLISLLAAGLIGYSMK